MSPSDYHEEELNNRKARQEAKKNSAIKGVKLMTLTSRVDNHDLMATVKKIVKLIEKQYEVRIVITGQYEDTDNLVSKLLNACFLSGRFHTNLFIIFLDDDDDDEYFGNMSIIINY